MASGKLLYPLLGVGSFFCLFLIGLSVAYSLGLPIAAKLLVGIVSGAVGITLVVHLEQHDQGD